MNALTFITQDWSANRNNTKGRLIGLLFRMANSASRHRGVRLLLTPYLMLYRLFVEWTLGVELPYDVVAGPDLKVYHGQALVVHRHTRIGRNCTLRQSTTIGNNGQRSGCPVIGNHVNIGANVCIIGSITIGDYVTIGAGSVVTKSIPAHCVVVGNPARIIRQFVHEELESIPALV